MYDMLGQLRLHCNSNLMRMDDERLLKQVFHGDIPTCSGRQEGQVRRYKDTLETFLKRLQTNPARDRPTWRRTVKSGAVVHEANRITAAKAKSETRKSQLRPLLSANAQPPATCPCYERTFWAPIGLIGYLHTNCSTRTTPPDISPSSSPTRR
ncbi:hypothetical protein SprV_0100004900 [Sparganum proliferum]